MENYKYQTWEAYIYQQICKGREHSKELGDKYLSLAGQPNLTEFLDHQFKQVVNAMEAGCSNDHRWGFLQSAAIAAKESLKENNVSLIALAFMRLGATINELTHPHPEVVSSAFLAELNQHKQTRSLFLRNAKIKFLKGAASQIAEDYWESDTRKEIRITSMCELIWPKIVELADDLTLVDLLPNDASKLKPWIRGIAPEWAKKGGRPKKT